MKFDNLGWLDEAVEIDYLSKSMDRQGQPIKYIVLHGTAGGSSAQAIGEYFRDSNVDASAHFVIGQDGTIVQGVNVLAASWSNGLLTTGHAPFLPEDINANLYTVAIEHVKPSTDNSDALTDIQAQKSFELVQCLCDTYNIPKHAGDASGGILKHADLDPINRSRCPGAYDWDGLWNFLRQGGDAAVLTIDQASQYFIETQKGVRWHCKSTNQDIAYGILTYYRTCTGVALNGISQYGLPISGEEAVPNTKSAVLQRFERGAILYDPANEVDRVPGISGPCYPAHIDKEPGQDPRIAQLQAEVATLQKSPPNQPTTPIITINTAQAISSLQAMKTALQSMETAVQTVINDLEPS